MKKLIISTVVGICLLASVSYGGIEGGEKEIGGAFTVMKPSEGDTVWMLFGTLGYYMTPQVRLAALGVITGGEETTGIVGGTVDYLLNQGADVIPYVGAGLLTAVGDDSDSGALLDVHGGIKQFLSEKTSLNYEVKYYTSTDDTSSGVLMGTIGFSVYF